MDRRTALALALGLAAAGASMLPAGAAAQEPAFLDAALKTAGDGQTFNPAQLLEIARLLASRPYAPPAADLPSGLDNLTYEQYVSIRTKPEAHLWRGEGRGFSIEPLHRGFAFSSPVRLFSIQDGTVSEIRYTRDIFDFGSVTPPNPDQMLHFSGFRIFSDVPGENRREVAIFQGATFFRAIANGQTYGVHARTLMLRPADPRGEELPQFRALWIERPATGSGTVVIHALLDSESVAGVVRFTLRPGDITITDIEMTLIARTQLDHIGIGGATANFLFGPQRRSAAPDTRVAVHEIDGLQMHNGRAEWLWRPVDNPETLQISAFIDTNPKGFGLLQRGREFSLYEDDVQHFERRPGLWIEPLEDWGEGSVQLIEVPTPSEANANIIAYWRPSQPVPAASETSFSCRLYWCWHLPERPKIALARGTRIGSLPNSRLRRFAVSFTGEELGAADIASRVKILLSASRGTVSNTQIWPYPERKLLRVLFDLDPGGEPSSELRLVLEENGKRLSETWLFRWTP